MTTTNPSLISKKKIKQKFISIDNKIINTPEGMAAHNETDITTESETTEELNNSNQIKTNQSVDNIENMGSEVEKHLLGSLIKNINRNNINPNKRHSEMLETLSLRKDFNISLLADNDPRLIFLKNCLENWKTQNQMIL